MINLKYENTFQGPNPYGSNPVVLATIDISPDTLAHAASLSHSMAKEFAAWFKSPPLEMSDPSLYVARFLTAWSLAALNEGSGFLHSAGARREGSKTVIWVGFHNPNVSFSALDIAARLFVGIGTGRISDEQVELEMSALWALCMKHHPDDVIHILLQGAQARNIPYMPLLPQSRLWQFGWGRASTFFNRTSPKEDSHVGTVISRDKALSKAYFARLGIPCLKHALVSSEAELANAAANIGWPCVVKPLDGQSGRGVTTDIRNQSELLHAFALARAISEQPIMIEPHIDGDTIRLFVVRGNLLAAIRKEPPSIVGDGNSTIRTLITKLNQGRGPNARGLASRRPIPIDEALSLRLARQALTADSVLPKGGRLFVKGTGGSAFDVSTSLHRDTARMAEMLADAFGITIAGIDYITKEPDKSPFDGGGIVLEINSFPGLRPLMRAGIDARLLGQTLLGSKPGRIPVAMVLATKSKLAEVRNLLPANDGDGWVCHGFAGVGGTPLAVGNRSFVDATAMVLQNPRAASVTVACDIDEFVRLGLPVDRADRAILYGVQLEKEWALVLDNHCDDVMVVQNTEALGAELKKWSETLGRDRSSTMCSQ
jgi:D-alanine-D-alanine ligase-like ATP-grasp enzyme